ncbi:MAG: hypothetical protein JWM95_5267 [Gemmatimonadetes bacterium]|nr:hypothetical protein [Gemmatimonadota bacterium]
MRTRVGLALVVAVSTGAARVHAQQVAYAANVGVELDSTTQAAVAREVSRARDRGIPVEPLLAKVREGRLKRAPGSSIRAAVAKLAVRLDSARAALGAESTNEELVAGADALAAGAGETSLRSLRSASARQIAAPLGTLAQLVASGVKPARAVEMIVALIHRNATPSQVLALGNLVEADVASGLKPDESAAIRLRGIEAASLGFGDKVTVSAPMPGLNQAEAGSKSPPPKRRP